MKKYYVGIYLIFCLVLVSLEENEANRNENEIIEKESDEEPFHADSDTDPDYIPTEDKNIPEVIIEPNKNITEATTNRKRRSRGNIERVSRKRIRDVSKWADEKSKTSLNLGLEHENRKGIQIKGRQMGAPCANTCRLKCATKIAKEDRDLFFNEFWKLKDHTRKWDFIARHVRQVAKKQVTITAEQRSRRNYSRQYYFYIRNEKQRVCKTMFLETLNVSETWITTALRKLKDGGSLEEDKRGKHTNRPHKLSPELIDNVKNHINQFPVVPSHYTRKNTMKMYLEEGLTIQKMYRLYNEHCEKNNITTAATSRQYRDIFNEQFNIGFFKPKKDQCTVCSVFNMASDAEKAKLLEQYESHMKNKEVIRNLKDIDKQLALDDKSLCVACFDLQKVLATPLSNVSDFYYKSKYSTYNFTVYDVGNNQGYCYVWHEQVAKRGPNEIASCLWKFLDLKAQQSVKTIIFYSDNCGGQNRNRFVFSMFAFAAAHFHIDIVHRFLEKGHTQNEGDSMHAVIENAKKRQSVVYVPEQWVTLIRMAKTTGRVYDVTEMSQDNFFNFKKLTDTENWKLDNEKKSIKVSKIREIKFSHEHQNSIMFKYEFDDGFRGCDIKLNRKCRGRPSTTIKFPPKLYDAPLPIEEKKLKGLLWLCNTGKIPTMYHGFYKNLNSKSYVPPKVELEVDSVESEEESDEEN